MICIPAASAWMSRVGAGLPWQHARPCRRSHPMLYSRRVRLARYNPPNQRKGGQEDAAVARSGDRHPRRGRAADRRPRRTRLFPRQPRPGCVACRLEAAEWWHCSSQNPHQRPCQGCFGSTAHGSPRLAVFPMAAATPRRCLMSCRERGGPPSGEGSCREMGLGLFEQSPGNAWRFARVNPRLKLRWHRWDRPGVDRQAAVGVQARLEVHQQVS